MRWSSRWIPRTGQVDRIWCARTLGLGDHVRPENATTLPLEMKASSPVAGRMKALQPCPANGSSRFHAVVASWAIDYRNRLAAAPQCWSREVVHHPNIPDGVLLKPLDAHPQIVALRFYKAALGEPGHSISYVHLSIIIISEAPARRNLAY